MNIATTGPRMLTDEEVDQFVEAGYVILRGLLSREDVEIALASMPDLGSLLDRQDGGERQRHDPATIDVVRIARAAIGAAIVPLFAAPGSPPPSPEELTWPISMEIPNPHQPHIPWTGLGGIVGPHIDNPAPTLITNLGVNAFVFLSRVEHAGGAFLYAPGSVRRMRTWMSSNAFESVWERARSLPVGGRLEECTVEPGDAIIFDQNIVHTGGANPNGPDRKAIRLAAALPRPMDIAQKKPDEMSPMERTYSLPYLRDRFEAKVSILTPRVDTPELTGGFGPVGAYDWLRVAGLIHRFWTTPDDPTTIRRAVSADLGAWTEREPLHLVDDPIIGLHLDYWWNRPRLVVVTREDDGATTSSVFDSRDLDRRWRELHVADGRLYSRPDWIIFGHQPFPMRAREAKGNVVWFVPDQDPAQIFWKAGGGGEPIFRPRPDRWKRARTPWPESDREKLWLGPEGPAHRAPGPVSDLFAAGTNPLSWALVADVDGVAHYSTSPHADDFAGELEPVRVADGATPNRVRCFERGPNTWLVTYCVDDHVHWGEVHWTHAPGHVQPITTNEQLRDAVARLGLYSHAVR